MICLSLREIAAALGGEVSGTQVLAPGPGHSHRDRSLSVRLSASAEGGFIAHSFASDDWRSCRDHVRWKLGLDPRGRKRDNLRGVPRARPTLPQTQTIDGRALSLWLRRLPVQGTAAERYLRESRGYAGPIPQTLGFLQARGKHPPSMIAAFGLATEPDPGALAIADADVRGVHLTRLLPDGTARIGKIMVGRGSTGSPIVLAPPNDLLGLAVTEGIEDGLSVRAATGLGAWAAGAAGRMPSLADAIPSYIECVNIFGHNDPAGRRSATDLVARLRARGIVAILKFLSAESAP